MLWIPIIRNVEIHGDSYEDEIQVKILNQMEYSHQF